VVAAFGHKRPKPPVQPQRDGPRTQAAECAVVPEAAALTRGAIVALQRSAGNQAVVRTLSPRTLARYEAGEHVQTGKTRDDLAALVGKLALSYTVKRRDTIQGIASKFGISVKELEAANAPLLRRWQRSEGGVGTVVGFNAGTVVRIPPVLNPAVEKALKADELTFAIGGTTMSYGVGIAMPDLFKDPEQMASAGKAKLDELSGLAKSEVGGPLVTTEQWQTATGGRYLELAQQNEAHFAPSDPTLVPASGVASTNHKREWERYHAEALKASQSGDLDRALALNSFGDHFLTDAFASGHLINKRDVMEKFKKALPYDAKAKKFTGAARTFFDTVATRSFVGDVQAEFSQHETVEKKIAGMGRPNIDSADRFSSLLQGIHERRPDLVANAIARAVHTALNRDPKGIPVKNTNGQEWPLSGDETLNDDTRKIMRRAVAQSQLNVLSVYKTSGSLDLPVLYARVWDYTPRPTAEGAALIKNRVGIGTDPTQNSLVDAVVDLITQNFRQILAELVRLGILRRA
jgi:hypothetical protein